MARLALADDGAAQHVEPVCFTTCGEYLPQHNRRTPHFAHTGRIGCYCSSYGFSSITGATRIPLSLLRSTLEVRHNALFQVPSILSHRDLLKFCANTA